MSRLSSLPHVRIRWALALVAGTLAATAGAGAHSVVPVHASLITNCVVQAVGAPLAPPVGVSSITVPIPSITVGSTTIGGGSVTVPAQGGGSLSVGVGVGGCVGLQDSFTGQVCLKLLAETVSATGTHSWSPFPGGLTCIAMVGVPGGNDVAAAPSEQVYFGLPGAGAPAGAGTTYSGAYQVLGSVDATVDGVSDNACTQTDGSVHAACSSSSFTVL